VDGSGSQTSWRYVRTIQSSIHRHRIDSEQVPEGSLDRSAAGIPAEKLASSDTADVSYALDLLEGQGLLGLDRHLRSLLSHEDADIRRRALAILSAARDTSISRVATDLLHDPDLGVRTEALLYVTLEMRVDPIRQLEELGEFEDFSIRAGMAAFLPPRPVTESRCGAPLLSAMAHSDQEGGVRDRLQAARVLSLVPGMFTDLLVHLISDPDPAVARQAVAATSVVMRDEVVSALLGALARPELTADAADKLSRYGNAIVPRLSQCLHDEPTSVETRRELPQVLVGLGTPVALEVLIEGLLQSDVTLRHRVIALATSCTTCILKCASISSSWSSSWLRRSPGTTVRTRGSGPCANSSKTMSRRCKEFGSRWIRSSSGCSASWRCSFLDPDFTMRTSACGRPI
jgi:hypothetical protein